MKAGANDRQLYLACWRLFYALAVQIDQLDLPRRLARAMAAAPRLLAGENMARA